MRPRALTFAAALLSLSGLARADVDPAAKQKLDAMVDAVKQAKAITYRCEFFGSGGFMAMLPVIHVEVTQKRNEQNPSAWQVRYEGRREAVSGAAGVPAVDILVIADGPKRIWLDTPNKAVVERMEAQATGDAVFAASLAAVREMLEPDPFSKEVASPTIKPEKEAKADNVDCDVITIDKGANQDSTKWTIGKEDHLPRMIERTMAGVGTQVWKLSGVKLNPDAPPNLFTIATPEGFKDDRLGSPAAPPPQKVIATGPAGETAAGKARATGVNPDDLAPDFELATPAGERLKLHSLRGNVVLLDFWGTWCLPCKKSSPEIQKLADDYKNKPVKIYGISVKEPSDEKPAAYMKDHNYTYGLLLKGDSVASDLYKVKSYPTFVLIGQEGQILRYDTEFTPEKTFTDIRAAIDAALNGGGAKPQTTTEGATTTGDGKTTTGGGSPAADK
jgi:thiol-disulfide isomerase/thioredoxin